MLSPYTVDTTIAGNVISYHKYFRLNPYVTVPYDIFNIPCCIHDIQVAEWGNIYIDLKKLFNKCGVC